MDIVYPVGSGSKWDNNELRYSLRSVAKHLIGVGKVWIVGERPEWLTGVEHIAFPDAFGKDNPTANTLQKVLAACNAGVSERFLYMNDDFFIIWPNNIKDIQPLYKNDLLEWPSSYFNQNAWRQRMLRTMKVLQAEGLPTLCFDIHAPFPLEVTKFRAMAERFDYQSGGGLNWRSLYGNINYTDQAVPNGSKKVAFYEPTSARVIARRIKCRRFLAVGEEGLNEDFKRLLGYWFKGRCKYEVE